MRLEVPYLRARNAASCAFSACLVALLLRPRPPPRMYSSMKGRSQKNRACGAQTFTTFTIIKEIKGRPYFYHYNFQALNFYATPTLCRGEAARIVAGPGYYIFCGTTGVELDSRRDGHAIWQSGSTPTMVQTHTPQ